MEKFRKLSISISFVIAGYVATAPRVEASETPKTAPPLLRWSKPAVGISELPPILVFLTSGVLAVSGTLEQGESERRGKVELLDVQTGGVKQTLSWSAPSSAPVYLSRAVVPLGDRRFLLRSWGTLKLFSSDGEVLRIRTVAEEGSHPDYNPKLTIYDRWDLASDPSGEVLLATLHRSGQPAAEEHWLSPKTLDDIQVETADTVHCCQAVGREQVVYRVSAPKLRPFFIRSKGEQPRPLCEKCFGREAAFLDDQWIVLASFPKGRFLIVSNRGDIKVDETIGKKDDAITQISVAPISRQIALLFSPQHLKSPPGNYLVCIYDVDLRRVTFRMQIHQRIRREPPWDEVVRSPHIALSPDGKSLAILDDSMVRVYAIGP